VALIYTTHIKGYPLLLKEILKYTAEMHPDFRNLLSARDKMEVLLSQINNKKRALDDMARLVELSGQIAFDKQPVELILPTRRIIIEGDVILLDNNKENKRVAFLFNDALLLVKKQAIGKKYKFKDIISLTNATVNGSLSDIEGTELYN
jgi:hypothetical protein